MQGLYPVNTLRNVAMNNCRTDYFILADVDFVPNKARLPPPAASSPHLPPSSGCWHVETLPPLPLNGTRPLAHPAIDSAGHP